MRKLFQRLTDIKIEVRNSETGDNALPNVLEYYFKNKYGTSVFSSSIYNPQIQISVVSGTKRSIFRQKNKTKRSKKKAAHNTYKAGAKG